MKSWSDMTAQEIMSTPILTVDPEMSLEEAAHILSEHRISGALVADPQGNAAGVISLFDIASHLAGFDRPPEDVGGFYRYGDVLVKRREPGKEPTPGAEDSRVAGKLLSSEIRVSEVMSREIVAVPADEPLAQVARVLRERQIHRVFVTDGTRPVGVISAMDVLEALAGIPHSPSRISNSAP